MDIIATDFKATWKKARQVFQDINQNLRIYKVECVDKKIQYDSIVIRKKEGTFRVR